MKCESARQDTDESSAQKRHDKPQPDPVDKASAVSCQMKSRLYSERSQSQKSRLEAGRAQSQSQSKMGSRNGQQAVQGNEATRRDTMHAVSSAYLSRLLDHLSLLLLLLSPQGIEPLTMTVHQE